jgi:hypothetical protein
VRGGARGSMPVFIEGRRERESRGEGVVAAINGIGFSSDGKGKVGKGERKGRWFQTRKEVRSWATRATRPGPGVGRACGAGARGRRCGCG